jgi:hypothetical protein
VTTSTCRVLGAKCWVLGALCLVLSAGPVIAQPRSAQPAGPNKPRPFELRGYVTAGIEKTASPRTFDAIFGSDSLLLLGGGAEIVVSRRWILRAQMSQFADSGTRVFVDTDRTVFPLDIPLAVTVRATEFSAGYRFVARPRWGAYAAAGRTQYSLSERSNDETERSSGAGWHGLGGVDIKPHKWVVVAGEAQWTRTDDILRAGAAEALGESELGGLRIAARLGFAF